MTATVPVTSFGKKNVELHSILLFEGRKKLMKRQFLRASHISLYFVYVCKTDELMAQS